MHDYQRICEKWGISDRQVLQYYNAGRIDGAVKKCNMWLVPADAENPKDGRYMREQE